MFFAYFYPYNYSFLQRFGDALCADPDRRKCFRRHAGAVAWAVSAGSRTRLRMERKSYSQS